MDTKEIITNTEDEIKKADEELQKRVDAVKGHGWYEKTKKTLFIVLMALLIILALFGIYRIYELNSNKEDKGPQPQTVTLNLDGKQSSPTAPQVIRVQGNDTQTHTISYVPKIIDAATGQKEATDVQLDTGAANKVVTVKVNGKTTEVPTLNTETQKFEDGKLVVEESQKSDIEITGPEPSRWQVMYGRNQEGDNAIGVSYALGKVVRAGIMHVDGEKPFITLQADLGDLMSTKKKK